MTGEILLSVGLLLLASVGGWGVTQLRAYAATHIKDQSLARMADATLLAAGRVITAVVSARQAGQTAQISELVKIEVDGVVKRYKETLDGLAETGVPIDNKDIQAGIQGNLGKLMAVDPTIQTMPEPMPTAAGSVQFIRSVDPTRTP